MISNTEGNEAKEREKSGEKEREGTLGKGEKKKGREEGRVEELSE